MNVIGRKSGKRVYNTIVILFIYLFAEDVPRVRVKVFRGPTEEGDGELFATWGYWIQQPSR